jgi:hypothetical protein
VRPHSSKPVPVRAGAVPTAACCKASHHEFDGVVTRKLEAARTLKAARVTRPSWVLVFCSLPNRCRRCRWSAAESGH